jgi:DNA segregation ATPase FtsK/SpoIIIE-like protein
LKLGWQPCAGIASGTKSGKSVWVQAMVQYGD